MLDFAILERLKLGCQLLYLGFRTDGAANFVMLEPPSWIVAPTSARWSLDAGGRLQHNKVLIFENAKKKHTPGFFHFLKTQSSNIAKFARLSWRRSPNMHWSLVLAAPVGSDFSSSSASQADRSQQTKDRWKQ